MAHLIEDAGADYMFKDLPGAGSTPLAFETVFDKAVLIITDLIRKHPVIEKTTAADCLLYLSYLFFIGINPYFYCPVYLSHPDFLYTDGLFQQVLYFKDFFCSL